MLTAQTLTLAFIACSASAYLLTFFVRRYALAKKILDCPNERSSHTVTTPRGGGVAIVIVILMTLIGGGMVDPDLWIIGTGCALVAFIGFIDDSKDVSPRIRLLIHFFSACLVVYGSGGLPPIEFFGVTVDLGFFGEVMAVIGLVWLLNLYNFMDGINGIASVEGVSVLLALSALLCVHVGFELAVTQFHFLIAAAILGFLFWNFPSARIFMGDAGSGFIGIIFGALMLYTSQFGQEWLWAWLIMLGVFIVDATTTLVRRAMQGCSLSEAHCTHAYQWAARTNGSHTKVTLGVGLINILWLFPLASFVVSGLVDGFLMLLIAYLPLVLLALRYKAGKPVERA